MKTRGDIGGSEYGGIKCMNPSGNRVWSGGSGRTGPQQEQEGVVTWGADCDGGCPTPCPTPMCVHRCETCEYVWTWHRCASFI